MRQEKPTFRAPTLLTECGSFVNRHHRVTSLQTISLSSSASSTSTTPLCNSIDEDSVKQYFKPLLPRPRALRRAAMPSSCKDIRAALAACLQESDCVMIHRNKPSDCLRPPLIDTMPLKCQQLKKGYGDCKRGMVDMRKRFRGNQPIAVSKELEGGGVAEEKGGQLYAGRPAFGDVVKKTSGEEPIERDWKELENEKFRKG